MDAQTQARALIERADAFAAVGELPNGASAEFHGAYEDQVLLAANDLMAVEQAVDLPSAKILSDIEQALTRMRVGEHLGLVEEVDG
jgi:hypothetical protein